MTGAASPAGNIVAGRYEVQRHLGSGAFGDVYEVHDHYLHHACALKLQKRAISGPWDEAQVLKQLDGEFIVKVLNADLASGVPYVVTELAPYGTVADQITAGVGVPVGTALRWARHACQGVARIHDQKLLHRDIKPENLFLDHRQDALVGDLGLAALRDPIGLADAAGTKSTMAPEVARVGTVGYSATPRVYSARSDVYSLGATLFWMLAGTQPLPGISSYEDVWAAAQPDLWDVAPHVPQGLRDVVNSAIDRDPANRHASPASLDSALGGCTRPNREWTRVSPHGGHAQCFIGVKGSSQIEVCAAATGVRTQVEITARHATSGRAIKAVERTVSGSTLPAGIRSAINACQ